jgi:hypothetical protein
LLFVGVSNSSFPLHWQLSSSDSEECDWVINDLHQGEHAGLVPLPRAHIWSTVPASADFFNVRYVLGILPRIWQLEQRLTSALHASGRPLLCISPHQGAMASALFEQLPLGGVILPLKELEVITAQLKKAGHMPYFQVICAPGEKIPEFRTDALYEIHLVAGMVGLFQCPHLRGTRTFHLDSAFEWRLEDGRLKVTERNGFFTNITVPGVFGGAASACPCTETTVAYDI